MVTKLPENAGAAGAPERLTTLRRRRRIAALAIPFLLFLTPWLQEAAPLLSLGLLIYCLLLSAGIRRLRERLGATPSAAVKLSTAKTIGWAVGFFVFDGLALGQGVISAVVLACSVLYLVPMGIFSRDKTLGRFR